MPTLLSDSWLGRCRPPPSPVVSARRRRPGRRAPGPATVTARRRRARAQAPEPAVRRAWAGPVRLGLGGGDPATDDPSRRRIGALARSLSQSGFRRPGAAGLPLAGWDRRRAATRNGRGPATVPGRLGVKTRAFHVRVTSLCQ